MAIAAASKTERQSWSGEQRVTLQGLDWSSYLQIRQALPESSRSRLTYDRGILEITMPLEYHEFALRLIERFIIILIYEMGMDVKTMGSTTIARESLDRAAEPDCAYYIQNQPEVAGREIDFESDPAPDLVVEVDITHTDIDKNRFYAAMGVPEFWRYNGRELKIYQLQNGGYQERDRSSIFAWVEKAYLYEFLTRSQQSEMDAERWFRQLVRTKL